MQSCKELQAIWATSTNRQTVCPPSVEEGSSFGIRRDVQPISTVMGWPENTRYLGLVFLAMSSICCDDLDVDFWIKLKDNMTQHDTTMMSAGVHPCQIHLFFGDHGSTPQQFTNFEHLSKTTKMKPDSPLSHFQLGETPVSQVTRANFIQAFICKAMAIRLRRSRVILHKIAIECYRWPPVDVTEEGKISEHQRIAASVFVDSAGVDVCVTLGSSTARTVWPQN